jgi:hypothetical protein
LSNKTQSTEHKTLSAGITKFSGGMHMPVPTQPSQQARKRCAYRDCTNEVESPFSNYCKKHMETTRLEAKQAVSSSPINPNFRRDRY